MEKSIKTSSMIIWYFIAFFGVASFIAYHGGYALGKYKAHTENNIKSKWFMEDWIVVISPQFFVFIPSQGNNYSDMVQGYKDATAGLSSNPLKYFLGNLCFAFCFNSAS